MVGVLELKHAFDLGGYHTFRASALFDHNQSSVNTNTLMSSLIRLQSAKVMANS